MRRVAVVSVLFLLGACDGAPDMMSLGIFESPCETGDDCMSGLCLQTDGFSTCTSRCAPGCSSGYTCNEGVCAPDPRAPSCGEEHARCGPSFADCCAGMACVDWPGWGGRCSRLGCGPSSFYRCWSGCCAEAGGATVCAPPSYCE